MKKILALACLSTCFGIVSAQNVFPTNGGNVGIGTLNPAAKISFNDVNDGTDTPDGITWFNGAPLNYGIYRTPGPWNGPAFQQLKLQWDTGIILETIASYEKSYVDIRGGGLRVSSGNVGIGILNPNEKLAVNGTIRAREVKVETTNWPDYVFEEGYNIGTLKGLESYIKTNKHLPDMPTAKEIEANGLELGKVLNIQQKKIEELTLHLIEKDKQIDLLLKRMDALENKNKK
ncbi:MULTISPECIES: ELKS/Rab6-interacting/CAST family protein [unclassified Pedobacter]|uniref:ELKS/Rab6-interacting/CAST family protein n=1 Tax=unclassified Pedobacter TaxID=2628915 RepID=UPI001D69C484|nr:MULTISPECIES: ELKS/Rab6-interacting/CAST family protein [unclassified Pedobacter]CAH0277686.1 hypothetical protein SRABI36_03927 [Pedobacter sp. Bi36]CAH0294443.1 hypothetical protein SRABI126_04157 [Pedobacter sp. Bi126]